ncbi:hypothetical protein [Bradyrhizobium zhanjiangense]|uniref:hypothetical protein n=1 Tax=Bradyrhizobium zhanjiangense TaxID=1325107 RepID=UPI001008C3BC|nr:hypothetical protein [Bradyrhizobium zhanjiangense]
MQQFPAHDEYEHEGNLQSNAEDEDSANRPGRTLAACFMLALIGSGSALGWHSYASAITALTSLKAERDADTLQTTGQLRELQTSQARIAEAVQRNQQTAQAQQAEIRRLSGEISQLAAGLDSLRTNARSIQAATPPSAPKARTRKPASKPAAHETAPPAPLSITPEENQ